MSGLFDSTCRRYVILTQRGFYRGMGACHQFSFSKDIGRAKRYKSKRAMKEEMAALSRRYVKIDILEIEVNIKVV